MKRVFATVLCLALMCGGAWAAYYDEGNDGSSWETAYVIESSADLILLQGRINAGSDEARKYYKLSADIGKIFATDWNDIEYGTSKHFTGHFDGQGHTVMLNAGIGLFYAISSDAGTTAVKNLNLIGTLKSADSSCAALATDLHSGIIENCTIEAGCTITGSDYAGGISGRSRGAIISNCTIGTECIIKSPIILI